MDSRHTPFIVTELILVFGGAMAFAWWQFRDLRRERQRREERQRLQREASAATAAPDGAAQLPPAGSVAPEGSDERPVRTD